MGRKQRKSRASKSDQSDVLGTARRGGVELRPKNRLIWAVCGLLVLAVGLVFGQTVTHEFVNWDDPEYVYENPHVRRGLSVEGVVWAFTHRYAANWHPLTWMSHMLDCQVYGLWAGGHHLTNVLIHAATCVGLFLLLMRMTGRLWPSALVAALFAIHPLRVESVAWVAERKDLLAGLFFVLTLWAYVEYARRPFSILRYLLVVACFALGLMAKPMLVTLPAVLLLLDYWPLGRAACGAWARQADGHVRTRLNMVRTLRAPWAAVGVRVMEKLPLLAIAGLSSGVTLWAQQPALMTMEHLPLRHGWPTLRRRMWPIWASSSGLSVWPPSIRCRRRACRSGSWRPLVESWPGFRLRSSRCAGRTRICWSAGSGTWGCWSRSSGSCRWAANPWPTDTPTCRKSVCASHWFGAGPSSSAASPLPLAVGWVVWP